LLALLNAVYRVEKKISNLKVFGLTQLGIKPTIYHTEGKNRFSSGTMVSSTNKTDCHVITEILLKVALNTITQISNPKDCITLKFTMVQTHNVVVIGTDYIE
jgi:hypothetical protein